MKHISTDLQNQVQCESMPYGHQMPGRQGGKVLKTPADVLTIIVHEKGARSVSEFLIIYQ